MELNNIQVILCNTSHPGNIGATARAMKTMGIYRLSLVAPIAAIDDHAIALASNASDILTNTQIFATLDEALADSTLIFGMTARKREFTNSLYTPKQAVSEILPAIANLQKVALVFGSEKNGLTKKQIEKCNRLITIPGNPEYFSLNLSQAVQIICYELYSSYNSSVNHLKNLVENASFADNQGILNHLEQILSQTNFYNNKNHELTKRRLQNIIHKASLAREEVDLIRGMLKNLEKHLIKND